MPNVFYIGAGGKAYGPESELDVQWWYANGYFSSDVKFQISESDAFNPDDRLLSMGDLIELNGDRLPFYFSQEKANREKLHHEEIDLLKKSYADLLQKVNHILEKNESSSESARVEKKMNDMTKKIDEQEKRLSTLKKEISTINSKCDRIDSIVKQLSDKQRRTNSSVNGLTNGMASIRETGQKNKKLIIDIDQDIDDVKDWIYSMEENIESTSNSLQSITRKVNEVKKSIEQINNKHSVEPCRDLASLTYDFSKVVVDDVSGLNEKVTSKCDQIVSAVKQLSLKQIRTTEADDHQWRHKCNAINTFAKFTSMRKDNPVIICDADLLNRTPRLEIKTHLTMCNQLFHHEEYECTFLGGNEPFLLLANMGQTFKWSCEACMWQQLSDSLHFGFPDETILLVDITDSYVMNPLAQFEGDSRCVVRILDAAVINGVDVSELPFKERLTAAEKMINEEISFGPTLADICSVLIVVAQRFHLNEISDIRSKLTLVPGFGTEFGHSVIFTEQGCAVHVKALWGSCFINADENWHLYFARSCKKLYASAPGKQPNFQSEWLNEGVYSTFWQTSVHKRDAPQRHAFIWNWEETNLNDYGPRVIIEDSFHMTGLTLKYISDMISRFEKQLDASP